MNSEVRRGTVLSFSASDWTALVMLDGADVESQLQVGVWVQSQMMVADAEVACLLFGGTDTDDGVVLGPYGTLGLQDLHTAASPTFNALNVGTATGAATGTLKLLGAPSGSTLIDAKPATGAVGDAGYIFVNGRARFGYNGAAVVLDDNSGGKRILVGTGAATATVELAAAKIAFFSATAVVQQTSAANLTNNVTAGGVNDTIANIATGGVVGTDVRDAIYQLARKLKQLNDGLRAYGEFS